MKISYTIGADFRETQGKGASRRLRHKGKVPAILYGGHREPKALILDQQNLLTMISDEKFYSSIVELKVGDEKQAAIIKDIQMHPARNVVVHVDLQRVLENERIRIRVPIHFLNESAAPGVKDQGGVVSHMRADVEVATLPKDLPEYLELDLGGMHLNETKFLSDIKAPEGVVITDLVHGKNTPIASIHAPRAEEVEPTPEEVAAAAVPAEGAVAAAPAAAGPPGAPGAAPPATPAAGAEAKKDEKAEKAAAPAKGEKKK
ncbi:MAG: 50S ribosomal protein L25/general stress protein Ctc [Gammaproteobacteria bacterium]